jgi:crossover junction endodeoxyribonuclease RuvC
MIILGIDPGTRHTGYGVLEVVGRRETVVDYGTVDPPAKLDLMVRLQRIGEAVEAIIAKHKPDELAIEMPFMGKNAQAMLKLGQVQGFVMKAALDREIPVTQYAPREIKKAVVGNGNAAKEQVWFMLRSQLGLTEDRGLDASDALAVALCHAHRVEAGPTGKFKDWKSFVAANPGRIS